MSDFNDFLNALKSELTGIANEAGEDFRDELIKDGKDFVEKSREDLERWGRLVAHGELTREEFEFLLKAKKDLAQMEALKQKGLGQARIDKLKMALIGAVAGSAMRTLGQR